jgi:hypothetical protein
MMTEQVRSARRSIGAGFLLGLVALTRLGCRVPAPAENAATGGAETGSTSGIRGDHHRRNKARSEDALVELECAYRRIRGALRSPEFSYKPGEVRTCS